MEIVLRNYDPRFFMQWPFGVLMGLQTILSAVSLVAFYFAPFRYEGTELTIGILIFLLVFSIIENIIHVTGLQRQIFNIRNRFRAIPASLCVFLTSIVSLVGLAISTLVVFVGFIDSLRFSPLLITVYAILTVTCSILTYACGKIVVLLYRETPNGQVLKLLEVVIEGDAATRYRIPVAATPTANPYPGTNAATITNAFL